YRPAIKPSIPWTIPYTFPISSLWASPSFTTPHRLALITAVGPPDWPTMIFFFISMFSFWRRLPLHTDAAFSCCFLYCSEKAGPWQDVTNFSLSLPRSEMLLCCPSPIPARLQTFFHPYPPGTVHFSRQPTHLSP